MLSWLRRYRQTIFIATIITFFMGIFVGLGGYYFTGKDNAEAVAVVGGMKIPYLLYQSRVNQYLDVLRDNNKNQDLPDGMVQQVKQGMLRDMIVDEILSQQASKMGLKVTDLEVAFRLRNTPRFQRGGAFDQQAYFQALQFMHTTPEDYEAQERKSMLSAKFKQMMFASAKLTQPEIHEQYSKQREQYIKDHKGSDKGFEKEDAKYAETLQQSRALELINFFLKQISSQIEIRTFLDQREQGV